MNIQNLDCLEELNDSQTCRGGIAPPAPLYWIPLPPASVSAIPGEPGISLPAEQILDCLVCNLPRMDSLPPGYVYSDTFKTPDGRTIISYTAGATPLGNGMLTFSSSSSRTTAIIQWAVMQQVIRNNHSPTRNFGTKHQGASLLTTIY